MSGNRRRTPSQTMELWVLPSCDGSRRRLVRSGLECWLDRSPLLQFHLRPFHIRLNSSLERVRIARSNIIRVIQLDAGPQNGRSFHEQRPQMKKELTNVAAQRKKAAANSAQTLGSVSSWASRSSSTHTLRRKAVASCRRGPATFRMSHFSSNQDFHVAF